uniref:Uncharacterized protein n=1 Tax=Leviviridae sp. TaxID=2027243 RepID=A0A514CYX9_9VIRU|nr:MAG: hypothetical protein H4BulkLitter23271_000002 [Leviviridae sp.]
MAIMPEDTNSMAVVLASFLANGAFIARKAWKIFRAYQARKRDSTK